MVASNRSTRRSSNGSTLYLRASTRNSPCSSRSLSGIRPARSSAWVQSLGAYNSHTSSANAGSSAIAIHGVACLVTAVQVVVNPPVAADLEVLRRVTVRRLAVVERIPHAHAVQRDLLRPVDALGMRDARHLQDRRGDVDHVMELVADTGRPDAPRPVDHRRVPGTAPVGRHLLRPLVRRVHGVRPPDREGVVGTVSYTHL